MKKTALWLAASIAILLLVPTASAGPMRRGPTCNYTLQDPSGGSFLITPIIDLANLYVGWVCDGGAAKAPSGVKDYAEDAVSSVPQVCHNLIGQLCPL
jgi:hypothetical protein